MPRKDAQPGKRETAADRRVQALDLRKSGASYRQIGGQLSISEAQAYRDVQRGLANLAELEQSSADEYRALELVRLDMAVLALAPKLRLGDPAVISAWVRVSESRRKLLGLDAPTKIASTNPDGTAAYTDLRATVLHLLAPYPELRLLLAEQLDPTIEDVTNDDRATD